MKRTIASLVGALALLVGGLAQPAAAEGVDHRACVSKREYRGMKFGQTRAELEARWEVAGKGRLTDVVVINGMQTVNYRACGYGAHEAGVAVEYQPLTSYRMDPADMSALGVVRWMQHGATLHGRP